MWALLLGSFRFYVTSVFHSIWKQQQFNRDYYVILELCLSGLISFRFYYKLTFFSGIYLFSITFWFINNTPLIVFTCESHGKTCSEYKLQLLCVWMLNSYVWCWCRKSFFFLVDGKKWIMNLKELKHFAMFWWIIMYSDSWN